MRPTSTLLFTYGLPAFSDPVMQQVDEWLPQHFHQIIKGLKEGKSIEQIAQGTRTSMGHVVTLMRILGEIIAQAESDPNRLTREDQFAVIVDGEFPPSTTAPV